MSGWRLRWKGIARVGVACAAFASCAFWASDTSAASGSPASIAFDYEVLGSWAAAGNTLSVDPGAWSGSPTSITVQWYRCDGTGDGCDEIAGATALSLTLTAADVGHTLYADVTATNAAGSTDVATYLTGVVGAPTVVTEPVILGDPNTDGSTLSVSTGTWTGSPTSYAYQWESCDPSTTTCTPLAAATSATFQVSTTALNGDYLSVEVTASDASGSADNAVHPSFAVGTAHTNVISSTGAGRSPEAVVSPSWTGDASETGDVLVGDLGVWDEAPTAYYPQWVDCPDANANNCTQIPGATSLDYTVQASDAGKVIVLEIEAQNIAGIGPTYFGFGTLVNNTYTSESGAAWAPEPTLPPQITGDATSVGSTLEATAPSWVAPEDPAVSDSYQWVRCNGNNAACATIAGATSSSYALTSADLGQTLYVEVDGTNSYGTTAVTSPIFTPPIGAPINAALPAISGDTGSIGTQLTADTGSWINTPSAYTYQWYACDADGAACSPIAGATGSHYTTGNADRGQTVLVEVDASNSEGTRAADSEPSELIGAPHNLTDPALTSTDTLQDGPGVAELGDTLSVSAGTWSGSPTSIAYEWFRCDPSAPNVADFTNCISIPAATTASYTTTSADLGHTIFVRVTATNAVGSNSTSANPHGSVGVPQPLLDDGAISGTAQVGQTLSLVNGSSWLGATPITWTYSWSRCDASGNDCTVIQGATAATYTAVTADSGHVLQAAVSGSNLWGGNGWGLAYDSAVIAAAPTNGGGGGGGGGGSGGSASIPNLKVAWTSESTATPAPGSEDDFTITIWNNGGAGSLQTHLVIALPGSVTLIGSPYYERGSGCTGTQTIDCFLDYIPNGGSTVVRIATRVDGPGTALLTATATADRDSDPSDNVAREELQVGGAAAASPSSSTATPPAAKPLAAPTLKSTGSVSRHATVSRSTDSLVGTFRTNEPVHIAMTVTSATSSQRLPLLKTSRLAATTAHGTTTQLSASVAEAGTFGFAAVLKRTLLVSGRTYVVHLKATNARGKTVGTTIRFAT